MKKVKKKYIICFLIILTVVSIFWFDTIFLKDNSAIFAEELKKAGESSDVVIIFNAGGFGTVQPEYAYDFKPIIDNLEQTIKNMNYTVSVVPYYRTKETVLGKLGYLKEMFFEFPKHSKNMADQITIFLEENPDDKILMAGLSNGAAFVSSTITNLGEVPDNVSAIELGAPFWSGKNTSDHVLFLDNNGKDVLTTGNKKEIIASLLRAPFKWVHSRVINKRISLAEAIEAPGHHYYWDNIKDDVVVFVENRLK